MTRCAAIPRVRPSGDRNSSTSGSDRMLRARRFGLWGPALLACRFRDLQVADVGRSGDMTGLHDLAAPTEDTAIGRGAVHGDPRTSRDQLKGSASMLEIIVVVVIVLFVVGYFGRGRFRA